MNLELKNREWKAFQINQLFNINTGSLIPSKELKKGNTARITAKDTNNGIINFYQKNSHKNYRELQNFISVSFLGSCFYHPYLASLDMKIHAIQLKSNTLNKHIGQFIVFCIRRAVNRFSYGDQLSSSDLPKQKILLPITDKGQPDYAFMEAYIRQKEQEKLKEYQAYITKRLEQLRGRYPIAPLNQVKWRGFYVREVLDILSGRDIYEAERNLGNTPYISATANNNGIGHYVSNQNHTKEACCLSVNRNGSVGYSFYHPYKALFSNDCRKLRPKNAKKGVGLFISRQITQQKEKYGYGYKMGTGRLEKQKILLPVTKEGQPDYSYMENYVKQLEKQKLLAYYRYKGFVTVS